MRFKAKLTPDHVELLHNLLTPISRLTPIPNNPSSHPSSSSDTITHGGTMVYLDDDKIILSTRGGGGYSSSNDIAQSSSSTSQSASHRYSTTIGNTRASLAGTTQAGCDAEGIFCFAELITTRGIFREHVIQSRENNNAILMEVCLVQWRTALRSVLAGFKTKKSTGGGGGGGRGIGMAMAMSMGEIVGERSQMGNGNGIGAVGGDDIYEVTLKLAKRNGGIPHLCVECKGTGGMMIGVHHAVPVRIRKVEELQYHVPPRMGMPDVQLELPGDRPVRNVVERLRAIGPHVYVEGSMTGVLTFRIDSDGSSIRTTYNNLVAIHEDAKTSQDDDNIEEDNDDIDNHHHNPNSSDATATQTTNENENNNVHSNGGTPPSLKKCTLKLDTKKLYASLHWQGSLSSRDVSSAVLCMWENEMLVLDVTLNPEIGRFMYYVPVHFLSDEWN